MGAPAGDVNSTADLLFQSSPTLEGWALIIKKEIKKTYQKFQSSPTLEGWAL